MKILKAVFTSMLLAGLVLSAGVVSAYAEKTKEDPAAGVQYNFELEELLAQVETRYKGEAFSADFLQESTLKAIDVTDTARGRALFKRPSRMRWEYLEPTRQLYVSNGITLWVYSPEENQVMIGGHPSELDLLSDLGEIRRKYDIFLDGKRESGDIVLSLSPKEKKENVPDLKIVVAGKSYEVTEIITTNINDDETRIIFSNFNFEEMPEDSLFQFTVPEGADVIR